MYAVVSQSNFARGAVDKSVSGRYELPLYRQSGRKCHNFFASLRGAFQFRSGTWIVEDLAGEAVAVPFSFNAEQQYVLLFTSTQILFYSYDADGVLSPLLYGGSQVTLTSPYTLQQAKEMKFAQTLDVMYMVHPDVAPRRLRRTASNVFAIGTYTRTNDPFDNPSGGSVGWPASVAFHQGRLIYGGSTLKPLTFWASTATDFESHAVSSPIVATDAFTATTSVSSTPFEWVVSAENQIQFGTADKIIVLTGGDNGVTATDYKISATATTGSASVSPLRKDGYTFYAAQGAKNVHHFKYDLLTESFVAPETSLLARDLLNEGIVAGAILDRQDKKLLWLDGDGVIQGHIFEPTENDMSGWFSWDFGDVVSICSSTGGKLAMVINRGGTYWLETLAEDVLLPNREDFDTADKSADDAAFAWACKNTCAESTYLDASYAAYNGIQSSTITYDSGAGTLTDGGSGFSASDVGRIVRFLGVGGYNVGLFEITAYTSSSVVEVDVILDPEVTSTTTWELQTDTISGVTIYAGEEVSVLLDGVYYGEVTLDGSGDFTLPVSAGYIVVGKKYEGTWISNLIGTMVADGRNSWAGTKSMSNFDVLAIGYGGRVGSSTYTTEPIHTLTGEEINNAGATPMGGYTRVPYADEIRENSNVCIKQDVPMPLVVAAWHANGNHAV